MAASLLIAGPALTLAAIFAVAFTVQIVRAVRGGRA